ncbi:MAG: alpha/beta hydrolase [Hyphomicrobiaceae bacterium]|nr:alpha/beta hydrolase [Hyphomicrobiaceae bacterium]
MASRDTMTAPEAGGEEVVATDRSGAPKKSRARPAPASRSVETSPPAAANGSHKSDPPPVAAEAPPVPEPAPLAPTRSAEAPPLAAPAAQADWDVVPVFYGTDRARLADAQRLDYGSDRGRRLQLGHALVTVPRSHQVPQVERPWVYHLPFTQIVLWQEAEDPKKHFTIKEIRELQREEFLELVRKRLSESKAYADHAIVFLHGFNTSFEFAVYRTAQMAYDLKFDGAPFLYSWPSKGQVGLQDYSYDRESAGAAEPHFKEFLELVARETGAKSVSIIAHSMGNQLLLPVLRDLRRSAPESVKISQVILAAPDVDRDAFEFLAREIQGISRGVTLLAASNDRALTASRQFWGGVPRAGDVPAEGPIVMEGVDTIDVTAINTEMFSLNHSGYAEKTELLNDIQLLIQTGERPPEKRVPILERINTAKGAFWRYPGVR